MTWIDKVGRFICDVLGIDYPDEEGFREHHEEFDKVPDADFSSQRPTTKVWTTRVTFTNAYDTEVTQYTVQLVEPVDGPRQVKYKRGGDKDNKLENHNIYPDLMHWKATGLLSCRLKEACLYTEVVAP